MLMRQLFTVLLVVLLMTGFVLGWRAYHRLRPSVNDAAVTANIDAAALFQAFSSDEKKASLLYVNKVLIVTGSVTAVELSGGQTVLLLAGAADGGVNCLLRDALPANKFIPGNKITIKGKCAGYLSDVNLVDCVLQ